MLANLARALDSTLVVGVTENVSSTAFRNEIVAWGPDGDIVSQLREGAPGPLRGVRPLPEFLRPPGQSLGRPARCHTRHRHRAVDHPGRAPRGDDLLRSVLRRPWSVIGTQRRPAADRPHQYLVVRHRPRCRPRRSPPRRSRPYSRAATSSRPPDRLQRRHHQPRRPPAAVGPRRPPGRPGHPLPAGRAGPCTSDTGTCPCWCCRRWPWRADGWGREEATGDATWRRTRHRRSTTRSIRPPSWTPPRLPDAP